MPRGDAYHTNFDKEEDTPVFRQQEIAMPALFPASDLFYPDHASSENAISVHIHNASSEERLEQIAVSSKLRHRNSKNKKTPDSLSIIGKPSRGAMWKKMKASALKKLNGLNRNNLEQIASKIGIEVEMINVDGAGTNDALMKRVREWITEEMDRYFSESIDATVDPKTKKLAIMKLQSITEEIKFSKDKTLDAVRSDQTVRCNPSQQTHRSHVAPDIEQMQMCSVVSSSSLDIIRVGTSALPSMPPPLATTVIQAYISSETPSFITDTLQLSNKAENDEGGMTKLNEQQKMVCEPCLIMNDNISIETEEQYTNNTRDLPKNLKEKNCLVIHSGTECITQKKHNCCAYSVCSKISTKGGICVANCDSIDCSVAEHSKLTKKGGKRMYTHCSVVECSKIARKGRKCYSNGGGIHCSVAECPKIALKGRKCASHGGGTRCSVEECSKHAHKGGTCFSHGGGTLCSVLECSKLARIGGKCASHGGGKRCSVLECSKIAKKGGKCASHGGGTRYSICSVAECSKLPRQEGNVFLMVVAHIAL